MNHIGEYWLSDIDIADNTRTDSNFRIFAIQQSYRSLKRQFKMIKLIVRAKTVFIFKGAK
jgi:hypothetical protein